METKEYIVILKEGVDYNSFWHDIENPTLGIPYVPNQAVSILNNRDMQPRLCHYALTDNEAEYLKSDSRVLAVERPLEDLGILPSPLGVIDPATSDVSFNIPAYNDDSGNNLNWGLVRHDFANNTYGNNSFTSSSYIYTLDGTGVDIVIMDTGLEYYHPEFLDSNGNTRVRLYNWTGNLNTTPNSINFSDINGHGTACAGIAAGLKYGWAKNADIYPCKVTLTTTGPGGISVTTAFDAIKKWHIAKNTPGNPIYTGRPTVVNGSFGTIFANANLSITSINYRNQGNVPASGPDASKGMTNGSVTQVDLTSGSTVTFSCGQPFRSSQIDAVVDDLILSGVVFVCGAGNDAHKVAPLSDPDFFNYWNGTYNSDPVAQEFRYYNHGSSPGSNYAIVVGAIAAGVNNNGQNQKVSYSNAGANIDIYAVGWSPRTAYSNIHAGSSAPYWWNTSFKQKTFGGTSAAAPQVAGMAALYLQANPGSSPFAVKNWLKNTSNKNSLYNSWSSTDYTNYQSQWGGNGGVAYQNIQGLTQVKTATNQWRPVRAVFVKNASNQWEPVKNTWANDNGTWKQTYTAP